MKVIIKPYRLRTKKSILFMMMSLFTNQHKLFMKIATYFSTKDINNEFQMIFSFFVLLNYEFNDKFLLNTQQI